MNGVLQRKSIVAIQLIIKKFPDIYQDQIQKIIDNLLRKLSLFVRKLFLTHLPLN